MLQSQSDSPTLSVTLLGAGQEVGRSCCVLQHRGRTVVCDAGLHPAYSGLEALPFIDDLDWSSVDAILITHFHHDHAAGLTYITEKTNFRDGKGKVYMTHPTKALHKIVMQDFMQNGHNKLFTSVDVASSIASIIPISAHQLITPCAGVSFTAYHAGHVLGACMFFVDIGGVRVLYTGDYSREEDRHLVRAEVPPLRPDVLIIESTHGVQSQDSRPEKEKRFTQLVHDIVAHGGHVLLPTFALGRPQELLLLLDEYWEAHPELHGVPVHYASGLAHKSMAVYQTYVHTMNAHIRARFARGDNPFVFKHVSNIKQSHGWEEGLAKGPPCVVIASPGMLQGGSSRALLELWAPDARNGVIITGSSSEGSMARDIMREPREIEGARDGGVISRMMSVDEISFSAHVDYAQNAEFIELINAPHVVFVHGEKSNMGRLRDAMDERFKQHGQDVKIYTPRNLETLGIPVRPGNRIAKVVGTLAGQKEGVISGFLVTTNGSSLVLDAENLEVAVNLPKTKFVQKQRVVIQSSLEVVRWHLEGMFGRIQDVPNEDGPPTIRILDAIDVQRSGDRELIVQWVSSPVNDLLADSVLAITLGMDQKRDSGCKHNIRHPYATNGSIWERQKATVLSFLKAHFVEVEITPEGMLFILLGEEKIIINPMPDFKVTCSNEDTKARVEAIIEASLELVTSVADTFKAVEPRI